MKNLEQIIAGCKKHKKNAQKALYDRYAPILFGICCRYTKNETEADDILQEGFMKIFKKVNQYSGKGSFEGWMKRVIVNTAINYYHANKKYHKEQVGIDDIEEKIPENHNPDDHFIYFDEEKIDLKEINQQEINFDLIKNADFTLDEMIEAINKLPDHFSMVFNLFYIENYKHEEIAEKLNINIKTSWTRLLRAKKLFKETLYALSIEKLGV